MNRCQKRLQSRRHSCFPYGDEVVEPVNKLIASLSNVARRSIRSTAPAETKHRPAGLQSTAARTEFLSALRDDPRVAHGDLEGLDDPVHLRTSGSRPDFAQTKRRTGRRQGVCYWHLPQNTVLKTLRKGFKLRWSKTPCVLSIFNRQRSRPTTMPPAPPDRYRDLYPRSRFERRSARATA